MESLRDEVKKGEAALRDMENTRNQGMMPQPTIILHLPDQ